MTVRSSSFLCPNFPNAPTSAAAFAHRLSSQQLSSQRSSPSCTIGIYPIGYRPSGSAPLQRHRPSGRIAPVSSVTELREPPRAQKCRLCARNARKQGFQTAKAHKNLDFVLKKPENEGSRPQKRTKMPILCSGMVAASPAAPTGTQHCPPQTLRSASGSSTPGNRLPQPTTQPTAVALPPGNYRKKLPPCATSRHTTVHTPGQPTAGAYYLAPAPAPSGRVNRV